MAAASLGRFDISVPLPSRLNESSSPPANKTARSIKRSANSRLSNRGFCSRLPAVGCLSSVVNDAAIKSYASRSAAVGPRRPALGRSSVSGAGSGEASPQDEDFEQLQIREAKSVDYWAMADMHCMAFYPREPPGAMHEFMRLNRVVAVCMEMVRRREGGPNRQFVCLLACASNGMVQFPTSDEAWHGRSTAVGNLSSASVNSNTSAAPASVVTAGNGVPDLMVAGIVDRAPRSGQPAAPDPHMKSYLTQLIEQAQPWDGSHQGPLQAVQNAAHSVSEAVQQWQRLSTWAYWLMWRSTIPGSVTAGLGVDVDATAVLGAVVIDTFGEHLPPRKLPNGNSQMRPKLAYCSNLAVAKPARRRKVAARLLDEAESVAAKWGCTAMALHVNNDNDEAAALYRGRGYRPLVVRQHSWASRVSVSDKTVMLKRLTKT